MSVNRKTPSKKVKGTNKNKKSNKTKSNKTKNNKKMSQTRKEIKGIVIITVAILLLIMTDLRYDTGIIGKSINVALTSLFGKGTIILPYILIVVGVLYLLNILMFNEKRQLLAITGLFLCYLIDNVLTESTLSSSIFNDNITIKQLFEKSIILGQVYKGGGLIGNTVAFLFAKLFGVVGTFIITSAFVFIFIILFTGQSLIKITQTIFISLKNFILKLFKTIYSFVFVEVDEDTDKNNEKQTIKKKTNKNRYKSKEPSNITEKKENRYKKEDIKIFDFTDEQIKIKTNKNKNIVNLKLEDENKKNKDEVNKKVYNNEQQKKNVDNVIQSESNAITQEYKIPDYKLLNKPDLTNKTAEKKEILEGADILVQTLNNFNIDCKIVQINKGPTITRYELQPAPGVKVSKILSLTNDIALSLAKSDIRIEAPIPGKAAVGIEVPNAVKSNVVLRELIESNEYENIKTKIPFTIGKDIAGKNIIANIESMPHLLVAGATGSGKSVCINSLIMSILLKSKPEEVKLILIDPKVVELSIYNGIPHLLIPVVTEPRKASNALNWAVSEMTNRYKIFAKNSVRDIYSYNKKAVMECENERMPQIVIIIDELADLMVVAPGEVEESITRLAQLARAAGIHLVIATQRPSVDVITGTIKANIPSRIAFAVSSYIDSRTILDSSGAEKLLGKGDMLYFPTGVSKPVRAQGVFVSDNEVKRVIDFIKQQRIEQRANNITKEIENKPIQNKKVDEFLERAAQLVVIEGQASVSFLQRKLRIGYARAARLIDDLEERGIVGSYEGSKPRKVLITEEEFEKMKENN